MKLGISTLAFINGIQGNNYSIGELMMRTNEAGLNFAENNDINLVELVLEPPLNSQTKLYSDFVDLVNSYSLEKQVHGPFIDMNICSHNSTISAASVRSYLDTAGFCEKIYAKIMTIHPGLANFLIESIREINKIKLKDSIIKILDATASMDLTICLENMPKRARIMLDELNIEEILNLIGRDDLYLTYDTSHLYTNDGDVTKFWEKFHHRIKNIHIVDNYSKETDTHPPLGSGKIDFLNIFETLKQYSYDGPVIIELSSVEGLGESTNFRFGFRV